MFNILFDLSLL